MPFHVYELYFEHNCDINKVISDFFAIYANAILGDEEHIRHRIKHAVMEERRYLLGNSNNLFYVGKKSSITDYIHNNIYCIHTFI